MRSTERVDSDTFEALPVSQWADTEHCASDRAVGRRCAGSTDACSRPIDVAESFCIVAANFSEHHVRFSLVVFDGGHSEGVRVRFEGSVFTIFDDYFRRPTKSAGLENGTNHKIVDTRFNLASRTICNFTISALCAALRSDQTAPG